MKKKIITTSFLSLTAFAAMPVSATEQIAFSFFGDPGYITSCNLCHTNSDINTADKPNLMPEAKAAYNQDKFGLSGLKTFLAAKTPVTPAPKTCVSPQILDTTTNACFTPVPVCTGGTILNVAKNVCENKPAPVVIPTPTPVVKPIPVVVTPISTKPTMAKNTKPFLNAVARQWDAKVGEAFTIPLSVKDAEQDAFMMLGSVAGSKFSAVHPDAAGLPSIDFIWTPAANQVNKIFTISFQAKEKNTKPALISNKVAVKIRVWAAGDRGAASITKLNVVTSAWSAGKLNLAGDVKFNNLLTADERKAFVAQKLDLTVTGNNGAFVGTAKLSLDAKGNWATLLSVPQPPPCDIILQFDGQNAARTVVGCVKPVAAITAPITVANNFVPFNGGEREDDENEGGENEHKNGHRDRD